MSASERASSKRPLPAPIAGIASARGLAPAALRDKVDGAAARVDLYLAEAPDEPLHLLHVAAQAGTDSLDQCGLLCPVADLL